MCVFLFLNKHVKNEELGQQEKVHNMNNSPK